MASLRPFAVALLVGFPALAAPGNGYVDSKVCATCHREIAANYARTGMARSFFRPATANTIEDYRNAPELLPRPFRQSLRHDPPKRPVFPAALATGRGRQRDQRGRTEHRLRDGFGKSCPLVSAPYRAGHADRTPAWLVSRPRRGMAHGARVGHAASANPQVYLLQVHVLPQRLSRTSRLPTRNRAAIRCSSENCRKGSIASDAMDREPNMSAPAGRPRW